MRERFPYLETQWIKLTYTMTFFPYSVFTVISSKKEWISKKKNNKLTCTENCHLVVG